MKIEAKIYVFANGIGNMGNKNIYEYLSQFGTNDE